ncbi:DNA/RNA polymerase [Fistulina hepatica ATCC 64428]|nr:DNA/RNA polymerase [Fistulina hepatica ATCC 64428]
MRREKGKAKAVDSLEEFDLNPVITYRHLHTQNATVHNPLRVVALCDSDAFYAACEMNRLNIDKDVPLVVLQWDALIAVNYPARKFGISRMDKIKDAKARCPDLVVVHVATYKEGEKEPGYWDDVDTRTHKVSLDYYRRESVKIQNLFRECLPGVEIEKASIDEAFFDFSDVARKKLIEKYPYLAEIPADGQDAPLPPAPPVSWEGVGEVIPIGEDEQDTPATWHDHILSIAGQLMMEAKETIYTKLDYSTSAGIARNKFLAKLTASYRKPRGQNILRNAAIPAYLKPMPFQKIRFLGGKLGTALAQEYDASTVGDMLNGTYPSSEEMQAKFGENSIWVWEVLRGIDRNEVKEKSIAFKSMLASKNLPRPITKASEGQHWIRVLAAELALRLNKAREENPNLWPKTLVLHARKNYDAGRSKQAPFPFTHEVTVDVIAKAADHLWADLVGGNKSLNVTIVSLGFTGITISEAGQQNIEGFFRGTKRSREENGDANRSKLPRRGNNGSTGVSTSKAEGSESNGASDSNGPSGILEYRCPRCGQSISASAAADAYDDDGHAIALAAMQREHEDFHFAQDLAREPDESRLRLKLAPSSRGESRPPPDRPASKNKKKRKKSSPPPTKREGLEKFFTRK